MAKEVYTLTTKEDQIVRKTATEIFTANVKHSDKCKTLIGKMFAIFGYILSAEIKTVEIAGPKFEAIQAAYADSTMLLSGNTIENEKRMFSRYAKSMGFMKYQTPENRAKAEARKAERANAPKAATKHAQAASKADMLTAASRAALLALTSEVGSDTEKIADAVRILTTALGADQVPALKAA